MHIAIRVYGSENDLNRQLSRRGLFRCSVVYKENDCVVCLVRKGRRSFRKCMKWFHEGNLPYDHAFPKKKSYSTAPGNLESLWLDDHLMSPTDRFLYVPFVFDVEFEEF